MSASQRSLDLGVDGLLQAGTTEAAGEHVETEGPEQVGHRRLAVHAEGGDTCVRVSGPGELSGDVLVGGVKSA